MGVLQSSFHIELDTNRTHSIHLNQGLPLQRELFGLDRGTQTPQVCGMEDVGDLMGV